MQIKVRWALNGTKSNLDTLSNDTQIAYDTVAIQ